MIHPTPRSAVADVHRAHEKFRHRKVGLALAGVIAALSPAGCSSHPLEAPPARQVSQPVATPALPAWIEHFDRSPLDWITPLESQAASVPLVFAVLDEHSRSFLHARHDARPSVDDPAPAVHYGKSFADAPVDLARVRALRWSWRVHRHPDSTRDPWTDVAASVYVVTRTPGILPGRGFKLAWVSAPAPEGTTQRGLVQIALRTGPPLDTWQQEDVDLCKLYRAEFGPCEGEGIQYIGVVTDADNTKSVAEADYADFELVVSQTTP